MLGRGKCIERCADDHDLLLLRLPDDPVRYVRFVAHDHAAGVHVDGTSLCVLSVAHNDQIILCDKIRHQDPAGRGDRNFSLEEISVPVSGDDLTFHSFRDISVLGARLGKDRIVINFHISFGNISDRYNSLQLPVSCDRESMYVALLHLLPCRSDRDAAPDPLHFFEFCVLDLLPEI